MKQVKSKNRNRIADDTLDNSLHLLPLTLVSIRNDSVREAPTTAIPLIKIYNKLLLCSNFNDALTYLSFFSFKSCESFVEYIILMEVVTLL